MKRHSRRWPLAVIGALAIAVTAWVQTPAPPLPSVFPAGALLTVESRDFSAQLAEWNGSQEKADWLASDNYAVFSRSKLFIRLSQAQGEITAAAGLPALDTAALLRAIAGDRSALAIYDIGELRFLYVTELAQADALQNALWQARADFEPRRAAGQQFFVRQSAESGREVAFGVVDEQFLLSTSADLLAGALERIGGSGEPSVTGEAWYADAVAEAAGVGEIRLVYNLRTLARTPYFRSYWIQRNISELAGFRAGVVDVDRADGEIRERRVLLRVEPMDEAEASAAASLMRVAPVDADFVRSAAWPTADESIRLLRQKLLAPDQSPGAAQYQSAPGLPASAGTVGSASQLETRIDQTPPQIQRAQFESGPLGDLFEAQQIEASLLAHRGSADGPWPGHTVAIALQAAQDWPVGETLAAITTSASGLWTVNGVGASWSQQGEIYQLSGLKPLFAALDGSLLLLSDSREMLESMWARRALPADAAAGSSPVFIATWLRSALQAPFEALFSRLEHQSSGGYSSPGRQPQLFSENIAGFSRAFSAVGSVRIERTEQAASRLETVVYELE